MKTSLKKSLKDIWIHPGRSLVVTAALIIGLWGVGTIIVTYAILRNDLDENFLRTSPAHVVMTSDDFGRLDTIEVRNRPEIEAAEFRDLSLQRIEVFPDRWIPLWLYGVEDFNNLTLARFYHEEGSAVPGPGTMLIERDGRNVSNIRTGSVPRIRIGGRILEVPVAGISFDPAQAPATQDAFVYAYVVKETFVQMTGEAASRRLIIRLKNAGTQQDVQVFADSLVSDLAEMGIVVKTLDIPRFNEHPHQFQLNTLLALQGSIGLLAFLMGAVSVSQLMAALLARQVRHIGMMKAIGATRSQVLRMYVTMALMFGAVSSVIGVPLSVKSGFAFAQFVAGILNFNVLTTTLPPGLYVFLTAAGLFLPILFSLPAILRGANVSTHRALSDYGIRQDSYDSKRRLRPLFLSSSLILALRNTARNKKRLLISVSTIALGVAIFSAAFNVRQSLFEFLADSKDSMKYDVQVVFKNQLPLQQALAPFQSVGNIVRIEAWNGGRGRLQTGRIATSNGVGIVALPHNTDLVKWELLRGRWIQSSHYENENTIEIVMNQQAWQSLENPVVGELFPLGIGAGMVMATLVGVVREFDVPKIYIDKDAYDAIANPDHLVNSLMVVAENRGHEEVIALKKTIESVLAPTDLSVLYVMSQAERAKIIYDHLDIILTMLALLAFLVLLVSSLGMASVMSIGITERTREIGVLRAIGATPKRIKGLFVAEGMTMSAAGILAGLLLSWPLSAVAATGFGYLILGGRASLAMAISYPGLMVTLAVSLVFSWFASRIPARRAIAISTREALSYE